MSVQPLSDNIEENYALFLSAIKESGQVWSLKSEEGWVVCDSEEFEDTDVIPFWSAREYAAVQCTEEWAGYTAVEIGLDEFVDQWLHEMEEDGVLVGPNWNANMEGLEIEPVDLARAVLEEKAG